MSNIIGTARDCASALCGTKGAFAIMQSHALHALETYWVLPDGAVRAPLGAKADYGNRADPLEAFALDVIAELDAIGAGDKPRASFKSYLAGFRKAVRTGDEREINGATTTAFTGGSKAEKAAKKAARAAKKGEKSDIKVSRPVTPDALIEALQAMHDAHALSAPHYAAMHAMQAPALAIAA